MDNQSLLRKADLAIAELAANGGELMPEQGALFIRRLIKSPTMIKVCRVVEMTAPQRKINRIGFGQRILRKATSAVALSEYPTGSNGSDALANNLGGRAAPTTDQIELTTKEQIAEVRLPYDVLEDNIERATAAGNEPPNTGPGGLRQTLIELIAERAALDLEELGLLGDTAYVNPNDVDDTAYLSQVDAWLKLAKSNGNLADAAGATISKQVLKTGVKAMPPQFKRNKAALNHFISVNQETEYRDTLADRGTAMGDAMTTGTGPCFAYGSPVTPVSLMPENEGLYTDPLNLIFGIQRQISLEFDKDISARVYIIVLTCRVDYKVEQAEGIVAYENIASD
jgi:hypothetical protein